MSGTDFRAELRALLAAINLDVIDCNDGERFKVAVARAAKAANYDPSPATEDGANVDKIVDDDGNVWHQTMSAPLWAKAFVALHGGKLPDEENMLSWFANAIMAGWDHHAWRYGTPSPVPVAERLPEAVDRSSVGNCWWYTPADEDTGGFWCLYEGENQCQDNTHWLPHWALPLPASQPEQA